MWIDNDRQNIDIKSILINEIIDEFYKEYQSGSLTESEQLECLDFINYLLKSKMRYLLDFNKEKNTIKRDTQLYHLRKIRDLAKDRIKKDSKVYKYDRKEPEEQVLLFKKMLSQLNKKIKTDFSNKTKELLKELMNERWTVKEKIDFLKMAIEQKDISFEEMLQTKDNEELITSFLALLEMKKNDEILVVQERNFGEIVVKKHMPPKN